MNGPIEVPVKGAPLKVQWGANVARRLNAIGSFCPSGMLLSDGATGTGFAPLPKNLRDRRPPKLPGCFEIRAAKTNGDSDAGGFDNPYYMVGSRIYYAADLGDYPDVATAESRKNKIFALLVGLTGASPSASITTAISFSGLQEVADSDDHVVYPLYEFGPGGEIKCDLRNVPTMVAKEWMA